MMTLGATIALVEIEGSHMVAVVEDEACAAHAFECRQAGADGWLEPIGAAIDIDAVVDQAKKVLSGKSAPGSITLESRRLAVALLAVAGLLDAVAEGSHGR